MRLYNELNTIIVAPIERPSQNSLYFLNDVKGLNRPGFRESLLSAGKQYLQKVQKTVNEICSLKPELRSRKQSFVYVEMRWMDDLQAIHHWSLHTVTGRLMPLILACCQTEINQFIEARRKLSSLTLEDLHVPKAFLCNVSGDAPLPTSSHLSKRSSTAATSSSTIIPRVCFRCRFCNAGTS